MKKMKCSSCGGEINIDSNSEYGICPYCNTKYKLNDDVNFNIKIDDNTKEILNKGIKQFNKFSILPIIIFFIAIIATGIIIFKFSTANNNSNKIFFNNQFSGANGTKNSFFLQHTLDNIVESNKKYERKVVVEYENKEIINENDIIELKHSLSGNYEVLFNYDKNGFINKIIIEKIN